MNNLNKQKIEELNFILSKINYDKNTQFLDLGCGYGDMSELLHRAGYKILGVDKVNALKFNVPFVKSKAEDFDVSQFDVIISYGLLEFTEDPIYLLNKLNREMKKDSILLFAVPNVCSLSRRIKCLIGKNPNRERESVTWDFTFSDIERILEDNWEGRYEFIITHNIRIKNIKIPTLKNFSNPIMVICKNDKKI